MSQQICLDLHAIKMSSRKRNEFLDGEDSDEDPKIGSDTFEESRGAIASRASKRRKVDVQSEDEESSDDAVAVRKKDVSGVREVISNDGDVLEEDLEDHADLVDNGKAVEDPLLRLNKIDDKTRARALKQNNAAQKAVRKSGVLYISRVPPFMKPQTLKHFLAPHAPKGLGRIFLTPEDHAAHSRRVKSGGNKKKSFTDGWVEFTSKSDAKVAAETLNGNIIGGKKGNFYHDDLWNIKYLKGFKWSHLTEQIAAENAERVARLREEVRRTRVENKAFLEDVEKGKMLEGMESKKMAKVKDGNASVKSARTARDFKQRKVQAKENGPTAAQSDRWQRTLTKIF